MFPERVALRVYLVQLYDLMINNSFVSLAFSFRSIEGLDLERTFFTPNLKEGMIFIRSSTCLCGTSLIS